MALENLRYAEPYFRLQKCARIVNKLAQGRNCDLLDIGCGPATLAGLLQKNVNYFGIDIAIHAVAPNLRELDLARRKSNSMVKTLILLSQLAFSNIWTVFRTRNFPRFEAF